MKEEGIPFKIVTDNSFEMKRVIKMPRIMVPVNMHVERKDWNGVETVPTKNMVMIAISVGKRPLQGTKLFVMTAISLSRGESIILHPATPQALHPNPIHMVYTIL